MQERIRSQRGLHEGKAVRTLEFTGSEHETCSQSSLSVTWTLKNPATMFDNTAAAVGFAVE